MSKKNFNIDGKDVVEKDQVFNKFTLKDFSVFLRKFCGVFIYRGKKAYSIKMYDYLLQQLKNTYKKDPILLFYMIVKKIVPFFLLGYKRYGRRLVYTPIVANMNRKHRFMLNWLVRQLKNRSNTCGVKREDVLNLMIETYKGRSTALNLKKEFYKLALDNRFNMRRNKQGKTLMWKLQKEKKNEEKKMENKMLLLNMMKKENEIKRFYEIKEKKAKIRFFETKIKKKRINYKKYFVK